MALSIPFLGQFKMAAPTGGTPSVGAEAGTDFAAFYKSMVVTPTTDLITCGPVLKDNFSSEQPGAFSVPMTLTLESLTIALIETLTAIHKARTKHELVYMPLASPALGSPDVENPQVTVQFFFNTAPSIPTVVNEKSVFELAINATFYDLEGASSTNYGTFEP